MDTLLVFLECTSGGVQTSWSQHDSSDHDALCGYPAVGPRILLGGVTVKQIFGLNSGQN